MKTLLFYIVVAVAFCSCINQKFLAKNQLVFKAEPATNNKTQIKAYSTGSNTLQVQIKDSADVLLIEKKDSARKFILPTVVEAGFVPNARYINLMAKGKYYFPENNYPLDADSNSNHLFIPPQKLQYREDNFVLQAVTTPIKIRPAFTKARLKDSLKQQALAELNIGVAFGLKRSWVTYKSHLFENGQKAHRFSISGSGFISIGGTNVKPITTRYLYPYEKTETAISYGAIFFAGFNNLNLGISVGTDHLLNSKVAKRWIYDGSLWYGITLAYDLVR